MASSDDTISETATAEYPDGPITCCVRCISKEVHVLKYRTWTISLIISFCSSILSLVFFLIAFATISWVRVEKMDEYPPTEDLVGLWQECVYDTKCAYITGDITGAGFKTSQVLAVLCLVLILAGCGMTIKYTFSQQPKDTTGNTVLFLRFICFFLLLLLIPVFAMTWDKDHARYDKSVYDHKMDYSFVLVAVTFVFEAMGAFFTYCEVMVIQRKLAKPLIRQPKTVNYYDGITNEGFTEITGSGIYPGGMGLDATQNQPERLEEQVRSRLDAKSAYENFAFSEMQVHGSGVAGPLASSMFRSTDDIARRFVGITLAEPQYASPYAEGTHNPTVTSNGMTISSPQTYAEQVPRYQNNKADNVEVKQSVSMQNIFNENLALANTDGRLVTSVSMYDISNEVPEKPYGNTRHPHEADEFSMQSWHPDRESIQVNHDMAHSHKSHINSSGLPIHRQFEDTGLQESQPRSMTNRGPVQRRVDANRQTNNSLVNSKNFPDISQQISSQHPPNDEDYRQNPGQYTIPMEQKRPYQKHVTPGQHAKKSPKHKKEKVASRESLEKQEDLNASRISHGQSTMSLHSVTSAATSMVGRCAETEI